ncbi:Glycosyltransferase Family 4 [Lachnospiraceae bacterium NE2001]|nr:Glycosyltransferase Family 4 [Lachnospiraceae bacterium NE2001]
MKVLLVSAHSVISGANKSMCVLAEHLIKHGCDVTIALRKHGDIINEIESRGLKYVVLRNYNWTVPISDNTINATIVKKAIGNKLGKRKIKAFLKKEKFDIVHNNSISSFLIAECSEELGTKVVWHFREFLEEDHQLTISKLYNPAKLINKADAGIAISRSILEKYKNKFTLPIHLIYNGIEYTDFWCEREILGADKVTVAVIGRVCEGKNQFEVIKALLLLHKSGIDNLELHLIGEEEKHSIYYEEILSFLENEGREIKDRVIFDGVISNIAKKYKEIDIVVVPSISEAFGRVAVEAMYSGCYVVGANTAGTAEILREDFNSLYELGNVEELSSILNLIIKNRDEFRLKAKAAQKCAVTTFTAEKNAERIYELYENLLNEKLRLGT